METSNQKKILLAYPKSQDLDREDSSQRPLEKEFHQDANIPPIDLMYLAAVAEKAGFEAKIADYNYEGSIEKDLLEFRPDYLLINVTTPTFKADIEVLSKAKLVLPNIITIAKGATFLNHALDTMYFAKDLDFILYGEPEETFRELIIGVAPYRIAGLYYRDDLRIKFTGARPFLKDLDSLPFPARHLIDNSLYKLPYTEEYYTTIQISRGCPYHCFDCLATPVSGPEFRTRSAKDVIDEIKECVEKYNIRNFLFLTDTLNPDKKWLKEFCDLIIENALHINWYAKMRPDSIDENVAQIIAISGCKMIELETGSGSQEILDRTGRNFTIDDVRLAIKIFKKYGIMVKNIFLIGLPWDSEDTLEDTVDFASELDSDYAEFYVAPPFPGTKFYKYAQDNNLINSNTSFKKAYIAPTVATHHLSAAKVGLYRKQAYKKFYLRFGYILKKLLKMSSKIELINFIKYELNILLWK